MLLHYDKISNIEFNRVNQQDKAARTFDITVHMKDGSGAQQFVNLSRSDYKELFRFLGATKIRIKNINSATNAAEDGDDDDDNAGGEDDPYLQRVKRQRQQQQQGGEDDDDDDDDESEGEDADFAPGGESDVDEEFDEGSEDDGERAAPKEKKAKKDKEAKKEDDGEDGEGGGGGGGGGGGNSSSDEDAPLKSPKRKAKKEKEAKKEDGKKKKKKDKNEPKRGLSAYMYFMQKNRELIKSEYLAKNGEEIKFTEIAKDAGARWGRRLRGVSWRCHSPLPWPPGAGPLGSWLRAGGELLSHSGPMVGLRCGPEAQPKSPIPWRATPRWKVLEADDKKEYDELAATDKQRYIDEMKAYKEKKRAEAAGDDASEEEEAPASAGGAAADDASDDE